MPKKRAPDARVGAPNKLTMVSEVPPLINSIGMSLKLIPAGTFEMGSNEGEEAEGPVHTVTLIESFYLGVYQVTQAQYRRVMGENRSEFKGQKKPMAGRRGVPPTRR